jgi:hypothetical protein
VSSAGHTVVELWFGDALSGDPVDAVQGVAELRWGVGLVEAIS